MPVLLLISCVLSECHFFHNATISCSFAACEPWVEKLFGLLALLVLAFIWPNVRCCYLLPSLFHPHFCISDFLLALLFDKSAPGSLWPWSSKTSVSGHHGDLEKHLHWPRLAQFHVPTIWLWVLAVSSTHGYLLSIRLSFASSVSFLFCLFEVSLLFCWLHSLRWVGLRFS